MVPPKVVRIYPHIDGFIFPSDVFCPIRVRARICASCDEICLVRSVLHVFLLHFFGLHRKSRRWFHERRGKKVSWVQLFSPFILYPPTTPQSVFPVVDQRLPETRVWILRGSCGGNRSTPLTGESERVLPQRGHSTDGTELSVNRLRSMGSTVRENGHLGEVFVCIGSFACSSCWDESRRSFSGTVCRSGSFPCTPGSSALF